MDYLMVMTLSCPRARFLMKMVSYSESPFMTLKFFDKRQVEEITDC